jgi:2-haloacid dehalogenase
MRRAVSVSRREFLQASAVGVAGGSASRSRRSQTRQASRGDRANPAAAGVKALVFDVFGTVVDWRTSVAREVDALASAKGVKVDGAAFADAWRAQYAPSMQRVRTGELPWTKLDRLHRMILDRIVIDFGLTQLTEAEKQTLNRAWHRLQPWPDTVAGLTRLRKTFILAPLSNGNISLMADLARHAGLPWDCILGAELVRHYKPDHEVYESAPAFLDLEPSNVMMVAAHLGDLRAAKATGLKTAFVARPREFGPSGKPDLAADSSVDVAATDFTHLAGLLGA